MSFIDQSPPGQADALTQRLMTTDETPAGAAYDALVEKLLELGITLAAGLPDDWVGPLFTRLEARDDVTFVRVAREPEAVGICTGAFFGGVRSVALMGSTGLLTCVSELVTLNIKHQVPLFMVVSQRGSRPDRQVYQEGQGKVLLPVIEALGIPTLELDSIERLDELEDAYEMCRLHKRPYVVWVTRGFIAAERQGRRPAMEAGRAA